MAKVDKKIIAAKRAELKKKYNWKKSGSGFYMTGKLKTVVCPHCGHTGKGSAMYRWHFNRCPMRYEDK